MLAQTLWAIYIDVSPIVVRMHTLLLRQPYAHFHIYNLQDRVLDWGRAHGPEARCLWTYERLSRQSTLVIKLCLAKRWMTDNLFKIDTKS